MTSAELLLKMIAFSEGNLHDIAHLLKVYACARTIGEREGLGAAAQQTVEAAAIVHDIACPLCRAKYGNTNGRNQELESEPLVRGFLDGCGLPPEQLERVVYLVSHHHSPHLVDGIDFQILLEADYLVNADESSYPAQSIRAAREGLFRTETGRALLDAMYRL